MPAAVRGRISHSTTVHDTGMWLSFYATASRLRPANQILHRFKPKLHYSDLFRKL